MLHVSKTEREMWEAVLLQKKRNLILPPFSSNLRYTILPLTSFTMIYKPFILIFICVCRTLMIFSLPISKTLLMNPL